MYSTAPASASFSAGDIQSTASTNDEIPILPQSSNTASTSWMTSLSTSISGTTPSNNSIPLTSHVITSMSNHRPVIIYADTNLAHLLCLRLAFSFKAVDYSICRIDLNTNEQCSDDYRRVNPSGVLPALIVYDESLRIRFPITNIQSILEYIEERWPQQPSLMPSDPVRRAKTRMLMSKMIATHENDDLADSFNSLEMFLVTYGCCHHNEGKYSMGDDVSLADCCLLPILLPPPLQQHSRISSLPENLSKVARNLLELEAVKLTMTSEIEPNVVFAALREL
ncbi:hypothetical protein GJ496_005170 [Pomphorhynchus laevis]|nr:hypothetical protein GJ496_005170 [Pomphorhynchus laevis]